MPLELLEKLDAGVELLGRADESPIAVPTVDQSRVKRRQRVAEFDADLNPFSGSEFGRGVAKGALGMGATTAGFGEALADLVGADSAKAWLKEKGDKLDELNASIPQAVESFTQIRNPADVAAYTLAAIGELAPQIVTSLGAGLGLKAAGLGVKTAAVIGAAATSYPQEAGGMYRGIREETGQESPLTALGFGFPAAALDTLTPARFLGKVFSGEAGDNLKREGWRALVKESFKEAKATGAIEALTETSQEGIALLANKFADSTYPLLTEKNGIRMIDAGLKGLIGGTAIGGTSPALQRLNAPQRVETGGIDDTPPRLVDKLTDAPVAVPIAPQPPPSATQPAGQQQGAAPTPADAVAPSPAEFVSSGNVNTVTVPPDAATATALDPSVVSTTEVPVASISLSQDVQNFKAQADPTTGVVAGQRLEGGFERLGIAPIVLWRRRNGALEVITGRHRLDLARRSGEKTIPSQIVDEASGFTREQALVFDAVSNIRDGQGSVEDYARFFRNTPNITENSARQGGLLSRAKGRAGWDIGKFASEDVFGLYMAGKVNEAQAVVIARSAPNNAPIQQLGSKLALEGRPAEYIRARLERERGRTESPIQTDMFGTAVFDEAKADEEADRVVAIRSDLRRRLQAVTGAAKNPTLAAAEGVDVKNPEQLRQRIESIKAEQERWDGAWWLQPDLVAQVRASPTPTPVVAPPTPTLRPGESGTGDLFQTADAPFNLAGETAVDTARVEAERVARQKLEEEANAIAASRQTDMLSGSAPLASMGPETAVTPAQDAEYLAAVQRGDTATAQRMVDDAAKAAGIPLRLYHGTTETKYEPGVYRPAQGEQKALQGLAAIQRQVIEDGTFTEPVKDIRDLANVLERVKHPSAPSARTLTAMASGRSERSVERIGFSVFNTNEMGIHLGNEGAASQLGTPFPFYVDIRNPLRLKDAYDWNVFTVMRQVRKAGLNIPESEFEAVSKSKDREAALVALIKSKGYDGIVYDNEAEGRGDSWIAFDPSQVKSADAVTRDESGAPIPLSQRFNAASPDIRYSASPKGWDSVSGAPGLEPFFLPPSGILSDLANLPFEPQQRALFDALIKSRFGGVKFRLVDDPDARYAGAFIGGNTFILNAPRLTGRTQSAKVTILHEATHAATFSALRESRFKNQADRLQQLLGFTRQRYAFTKVSDKSRAARNRFDHALDNTDEFVAAALTDKDFQEYLSTLRPTKRARVGQVARFAGSVLDKFWEIIGSIFGVNPSVLSETLAITDALFSAGIITSRQIQSRLDKIPTMTSGVDINNNPAAVNITPGTPGGDEIAAQGAAVGAKDAQTQPPLASVGPTTGPRVLLKASQFAQTPQAVTEEATMASGQITGLLGVLRDKIAALASQFIPAGLSPAEQQRRMARAAFVVNITKMEGIENMAQTLGVSPQQFDAAIAAMPNDGLKTVLGHHWWSQFNLFERNARRTAAKRDAAEANVMSSGFQKKIRDSYAQLNKADVAEQARKLLVAQLKNGLQQAQARAGQVGVNETLFATANEQIKYYSELLNRVDPIQRRMNDIIAAANTNQTLFNGIVNGTLTDPDDLLNAYLATGAALPAPGPAMVELRVAADVLARSLDLAGRMVASVASENAAIAQAVTDIESKIRHAVDARNFREVVNNVLRKVVSLSTAQGKATAIFKITQKPLIRQIELLESLEFGNAVFNATMADPVYKAMRNRANTLVGGFSRPQHALNDKGEPITPLSSPFLPEHTIYLPDGTSVVFKMYSQKAQWDAQRQSIDDTLAALTAWLANNPATDPAHDIYRAFYQWEFDTLNTLWHASFAHDSPKMFPAFRNFHFKLIDSLLRMFDPLADSIGTRDINSAKSLAGILKDVMHQMSDWASKNSQNITHTMLVAIKSHPEITKNNALDAAGRKWFREVFNPLFASLRNPGTPGYKVNDVIASSGRKVTREDMNAAIRQAKSTKDAMAINVVRDRLNYAMPPLIEDRVIPGAPALRGVLTLSPMMVPRGFGKAGRDVASEFINEVIAGGVTPRAFWRDLNRFDHVKSMVEDRGEEYSTISTFEDAFRDAKAELQQDPSLIDDMDSLVDYMAQRINSRSTRDEIETFITAEMTRSTNAFINSIPELQQRKKGGPLPEFDFNAWEKANAFTLGRSKAVAPPSFYEYGFKDTASILNFAMSGNSFYMEQFIQSLREIADKLRKYRDEVINKRTKELTKQLGETAGTVEVRAQNREQMRLGEELLRWERVDEYANNLDAFVKTFSELFTVGGKEVETNVRSADNWLSRLVGGILSGIVGTTRNAIDGGFFQNGTRLSRLESSTVRAFPRAAYHVLKTVIPLGLRTVPAVAKGVYTAFRNIPTAVRVGMSLNPGNWLKAEGKLLGQAVDDVSNSLFGVKELNQQLKNRGIGMTVTPSETVENIGDFWRSSGVNREVVMSGNPFARLMQSVFGQFIGSAVDVQLALFVKPFFPRVGDIIANEAVSGATLGALHNFEKRFRLLADTMQRAGVTGAALANHRFTTKEVFGAFPGLGTTTEDLRFVENWFVESNIDFHRSLTDWFKRLETDPTARWLTNEEKWRLAIRSVEVVNVATALNRPLTLRANFFTRMIGLVLGWNIHAYRQMATYIGQSAKNDKSQFQIRTAIALWMLVILAAADASNEGTELLVRMLTRLMGEPERATRLPHEFESTSDQLKSHLVYAFNSVPFVANVINAAFSEQPTKAGYSPYLLIQTKIIDLINYVGGVINSGDIGYRLPQTIKGLLPISSVVLNQLPLAQGLRPAIDATRLISRYADKEDLARPFARGGPGASVNVSPLSPFGDKIISAIGRGDDAEAERLYSQAVETARRLGKPNPEASVKQLVVNRLPISRALKSTPSAAEYSRILSRMSPDQRGRVEAFTTRAEQGLARLSIETGKLRPLPPVRTTGATRGRTARSRYSRTSRIRRVRLGGSRSRSRLGTRRRRNSLVRQTV